MSPNGKHLSAWLVLVVTVGAALVGVTWKLGREIDQKAPAAKVDAMEVVVSGLREDRSTMVEAVKNIRGSVDDIKIEQREQRTMLKNALEH